MMCSTIYISCRLRISSDEDEDEDINENSEDERVVTVSGVTQRLRRFDVSY